jgi:basic amino acid/polyamine antiporter, APA family
VGEGPGLDRGLTLRHVYAIATGAMFSSGFFLLPGFAADETGPSVPLAYLLAGLLVLPAMLSVAELSTAMPRAGGPYHFLRRSMGGGVATVGALGLWLALVLKAAFALMGIGAYLSLVVELPTRPVALVLAAAFTALNLFGAKESARLQVWLVGLLVVVLGLFVIVGAVHLGLTGSPGRDDGLGPIFTDGTAGLIAATGLVFVSYAGLPQVASVAGEIRDPAHNIPRGLILSLVTATSIYVTGTAVMVGVLSAEDLRDNSTPVAAAVEQLPLFGGLVLVVAAALAAFASTGNAGIMSAARYPLALANDRLLWGRFARLGRSGTPTLAVVASGTAVAALVALVDTEGIAKLGSAFVLVMFALLNLAVLVLRRAHVSHYRPTFRSPLHPWLQLLGVAAPVALIVDLGGGELAFVASVVVGGLVWFRLLGRRDATSGSTVAHLLRRSLHARGDSATVAELQEHGPLPEDRPADVLEDATIIGAAAGATVGELRSLGIARLAEVLEVAGDEAEDWLDHTHELDLVIEPDRSRIDLLLLDAGEEVRLVLAWAPARPDPAGPPQGRGRQADPGRTVAIVAGPEGERDRLLRICALLAVQLTDQRLSDRMCGLGGVDQVLEMLIRDAVGRQGGERQGRDGPRRRS